MQQIEDFCRELCYEQVQLRPAMEVNYSGGILCSHIAHSLSHTQPIRKLETQHDFNFEGHDKSIIRIGWYIFKPVWHAKLRDFP